MENDSLSHIHTSMNADAHSWKLEDAKTYFFSIFFCHRNDLFFAHMHLKFTHADRHT